MLRKNRKIWVQDEIWRMEGGSGPVNKRNEPDYPRNYQHNKYGNPDFCQHNLSWGSEE
jgi:hypothetical protein